MVNLCEQQGKNLKFTIAIDGPAAAGKGTISRGLADHFGFAHLDTGLLYRAVGRRTLDGAPAAIAAATLRLRDIARTDLRTPEVSEAASKVATLPEVRAALVTFQKDFAAREGGAVPHPMAVARFPAKIPPRLTVRPRTQRAIWQRTLLPRVWRPAA